MSLACAEMVLTEVAGDDLEELAVRSLASDADDLDSVLAIHRGPPAP